MYIQKETNRSRLLETCYLSKDYYACDLYFDKFVDEEDVTYEKDTIYER
jgi:hypothetical protein